MKVWLSKKGLSQMTDIKKIEEVFAAIFGYLADKGSKTIAGVEPFGDKYSMDESKGGMIVYLRNGKNVKVEISWMK
jgi:hypothetical protein